jgi:uncharacterized delta-60 repeat protein
MSRKDALSLPARGRFVVLVLAVGAFLTCLALPTQFVRWLLPSAAAKVRAAGTKTGEDSPQAVVATGAISFSAPSYSVKEGDGSATITLKRTGGSDGVLSGKVTLSDVTTSPADYVYSPGSLDPTFIPAVQVLYGYTAFPSVFLQPDGKLLVVGNGGTIRLLSNGSLDPTFAMGVNNNSTYAAAVQNDGKIIVGGSFTVFNNQRAADLVRLNSDGSLDNTFNVGTGANISEMIRALALQRDGKVIVLGSFQSFNGVQNYGLVRLNTDGSLDTSYSNQAGSPYYYCMVMQPDEKVIVAGTGNNSLKRVNTDGTLDNTFNAQYSGNYSIIDNMALQPDGKIIVVGRFDHVGGQVAYGIARINPDGSFDPSFNTGTGPDAEPMCVALQPDGKVLIGGEFKSYNGTPVNHFTRLNADGSLDTTFVSSLAAGQFGNFTFNDILLQPDGKILVRGNLSASGSNITNKNLVRLNNDLFVKWADGDTSDKTVTLPIVNDSIPEPSETLNLSVTPLTSGATTGANPTLTLTITDDDTSLSAISGTGTYAGTGTLTATLSAYGGPLSGQTITFSIFGTAVGTATTDANGVATLSNVSLPNSSAGTYNQGVGATFAGDATYGSKVATGLLTINKAAATITLGNLSQVYTGGSKFVTATTNPQFIGSVAISYSQNGTTVSAPVNVGSYDVTAKLTSSNYQASDVTGTLVITKATPTIFWNNPANIIVGTPLSNEQLNATVSISGTYVYNPPAGTVLPLGSNQLSVTFTPTDSANYNSTTKSVTLTVVPVPPPSMTLVSSFYSVNEGAGTASITVMRNGDTTPAVSVGYATSDGAGLNSCGSFNAVASSRCDYVTTLGTLSFAAAETTKTISIPIVDDSYAEGPERFAIRLINPSSGASIGPVTSALVNIVDNDTTTGSNPILNVPFFVRQQYIDFLGREPDAAGMQGWQDILNQCAQGSTACDRTEVSSGFFRSPEFQARGYFLYRFYSVALGRKPNYAEFMPDLAKVSGFLTDAQLEANKVAFVNEFMTRTEYQLHYGSLTDNTAYVDALLQTAGLPNHPLRGAWIDLLNSGAATKAQVLRGLAESLEVYNKYYNDAFVVMQYFGYLRRDPDILYLQWIDTMNKNGGDYRAMISGFMNSAEYYLRFGP